MYCTPKIHKAGTPLRPIVDYTGSIGYNTSRFLADVLSNVVGKTEHHVKNSRHLAETLADITLEDYEIFNSHDVVSLFTNTPISKSLEVIKTRLEMDNTWRSYTKLLVSDVMELLEFILTTTYFVFWDQFYAQKFGTAMGSLVSPMVAGIFMEFLEQLAITSVPIECKPKLWKRYVGDRDILEVIKKHGVDGLTHNISIQWMTQEVSSSPQNKKRTNRCPSLIPSSWGKQMATSSYWSTGRAHIQVSTCISALTTLYSTS